jgi:hypothetical protein
MEIIEWKCILLLLVEMLIVFEFALENARNAVLELQKCRHWEGGPPDPLFFGRNLV